MLRMIERGEHPRLALEAGQAFGIAREDSRQDLDGDVATQLRVARAVHLAHAARAQQSLNLVGADLLTHRRAHAAGHLLGRDVQ